MRVETITKELFSFDELSAKAKQNAIDQMYDLNVSHEWFDFTYEDAKNIDLKINGFDLDRGQNIELNFIYNAIDTAKSILTEHGQKSPTYKLAKQFSFDFEVTEALKDLFDVISEEHEQFIDSFNKYSDQLVDLESEFKKDLANEYFSILQNEFDYLTSEAAIIESIEANEYEFDIHGQF